MFIVSLDGMHCCIWEMWHMPIFGWYSKKFNMAGLAYELGITTFHNKLVWINDPFPAGKNDKKMFTKRRGLISKIPSGKWTIGGDEAYLGYPDQITTRNDLDSDKVEILKKWATAMTHPTAVTHQKKTMALGTWQP
jgi:hypothetical protein